MSDMTTDYIPNKKNSKCNTYQWKNKHYDVATQWGLSPHSRHRNASIVYQCFEHYGRQTRQHTHRHSQQEN